MSSNTQPAEGGDWVSKLRPGYFGRRRDQRVAEYDATFGKDGWRLIWRRSGGYYEFADACRAWYEESYFRYLKDRPADLDFICSHAEVMDNAPTNIRSGTDYSIQEAFSTHIQDIAVRNVLVRLNRWFNKEAKIVLQIRGADSEGFQFNPGNIPFAWPDAIEAPSLAPSWAKHGSVEDFWQSNKWLQVREKSGK